jgi:hypothetical protein
MKFSLVFCSGTAGVVRYTESGWTTPFFRTNHREYRVRREENKRKSKLKEVMEADLVLESAIARRVVRQLLWFCTFSTPTESLNMGKLHFCDRECYRVTEHGETPLLRSGMLNSLLKSANLTAYTVDKLLKEILSLPLYSISIEL